MDVQKMSSKGSSTSSYLTDTTSLNNPWTCKRCPQSDRLPVPIWLTQNLFEHPMDVQKMSSKWSSTSSNLSDTKPVWTPHGRPKDVLKVIVYQFPFDCDNTCLKTLWTSKRCPQNGRLPVPIWLAQNQFEHPMDVQVMSSKGSSTSSYLRSHRDVQMMSSKWSSTSTYLSDTKPVWTPHGRPKDVLKGDRLPVPIWVTQNLFEHPMDVQKMSSKWSSTSSYLTDTTPAWTPHGRPKDVLKVIVYQFLFDWHNTCLNTPWTSKRCPQSDRLPVPIWLTQPCLNTPMDVQKMSSKWSSTSSYLTDTTSVWTPHGRPKDVLKVIVYQFLFDWHNPIWTPHGRATGVLKVIVYQFLFDWHNICLNTPWTSKWCPQRDRLPVPIWLTQHLLEHPMNVQKMSSKWSSTSSYLTNTKPGLNTPRTSKWCPQRDRLPVPIWLTQHLFEHPMDVQMMSSKGSSTSSYLSVPTLFEHPMDVQKMSSKWSSTSSYLTDTTSVWTPHGRPKDVLKGIVSNSYLTDTTSLNTPWTSNRCPQSDRLPVPIWLTQHMFEHAMDVQMMSSKGSPTSSYLTDTTPVGTPHGRPNDVLKEIPHKFLFECPNICLNTPWTSKRCPQNDRLPVPIWLTQPCLNTPWTCKRCPQNDRLPVPIWLTQHLFEHPKDMQNMSSKWSSTSSYLAETTSVWKPHGRPNDVLKGIIYQFLFDWHNKGIVCSYLNTPWTSKWCPHKVPQPYLNPIYVYQFLFDWHNTCLNTPWTCKRCPQNDRLPVPIWLTQNQVEHPKDMQNISSKGSSTSSYLTETTSVWTPHGRPNDVLKGIIYQFLFECPNPIWTPHGRATDVLKVIVYQFLFDWHNICLNTPWTSKRSPTSPQRTPHGSSQRDPPQVPIWLTQPCLNTPWTCKRCPQRDRLPVPIWLTQHLFEHPMDVQMMSSKRSSTSSYLTCPNPIWTPHGRFLKMIVYQTDTTPAWTPHVWKMITPWKTSPNDVLKGIVYKFLFEWNQPYLNTPWTCKWCPQRDRLPVPIWLSQHLFEHPMDVQKMSSKWSSTSSYLTDTTYVWTRHGRPNDVLKGIAYQFLFDWHNICLNTPWTSKWCPQRDHLPVPIWVSQPYLNTPWTCKRCPQRDRLPVPIWLTQHLFVHPMDVQMMSSKRSSTSSYLSAPTLFEHPMDVQKMSSKWSSTSSYLTDNICLNTPWTSKWCPQRDRLPVPIWLTQHLFEHPMDVQMMSSKRSSTSSYLSAPTLFEHPMDVQKMSSKWSSTSSYLTDTTPAWTPHERAKDVLKMIVYLFLFD